MKFLATPIGLAGAGSDPETAEAQNHLFAWRIVGIPLGVAAAPVTRKPEALGLV